MQIRTSTQALDRMGRGRAHGLYDRDLSDRKEWNSDDEEFDEFGRRKKKAAKRAKTSANEEKVELNAPPADGIKDDAPVAAHGGLEAPFDSSLAALMHEMDRDGGVPRPTTAMVFCKFQAEGRCTRGVSCPFSHDPAKLLPVQPERKIRRLCRFFEAGRCTSGLGCLYAHGPDELEELLRSRPQRFPAHAAMVFAAAPPAFGGVVSHPGTAEEAMQARLGAGRGWRPPGGPLGGPPEWPAEWPAEWPPGGPGGPGGLPRGAPVHSGAQAGAPLRPPMLRGPASLVSEALDSVDADPSGQWRGGGQGWGDGWSDGWGSGWGGL